MNYKVIPAKEFLRELKRLSKRYRGLTDDVNELVKSLHENPLQGVELLPSMRKIRMAISAKGKGKSAGARVITFNAIVAEDEGIIRLLLIYDKSEIASVKTSELKKILDAELANDDIL